MEQANKSNKFLLSMEVFSDARIDSVKTALYVSSYTFTLGQPMTWVDTRPVIDNVIGMEFLSCGLDPETMVGSSFVSVRSQDLYSRFGSSSARNNTDILGIVPVRFTQPAYVNTNRRTNFSAPCALNNVDFSIHLPNGNLANALSPGTVVIILKIYCL